MAARERVVIGEAVEVELPIARLATRTLAIVIDAAVEVALLLGILAAVGTLLTETNSALAAAVYLSVIIFVFLVWPVTFETLTRGRSPGKYALGLRVVRDDGGPIRFRHALVRGLVGLALEWPGLLLAPLSWVVGAVTMLFSAKAKRVGDLAAGTMVLTERLPDRGRYVAEMPPHLAGWARDLDLTRVDDPLAMAVRQFLSRAHQMRPPARLALGQRMVADVAAVTAPPPPPRTSGWEYLRAVLAERRRREEARLAARRAVVAMGAPAAAAFVPGASATPGRALPAGSARPAGRPVTAPSGYVSPP